LRADIIALLARREAHVARQHESAPGCAYATLDLRDSDKSASLCQFVLFSGTHHLIAQILQWPFQP
jgi:hypothetical protein